MNRIQWLFLMGMSTHIRYRNVTIIRTRDCELGPRIQSGGSYVLLLQ